MTTDKVINVLKDQPFVVYSLPGSTDFYSCIVSRVIEKTNQHKLSEFDFIFAPFNSDAHPTYLFDFESKNHNNTFHLEYAGRKEEQETTRNYYEANCMDAINRLQSGELEKLVLSKTKIEGHQNEEIWNLYERLQKSYPQAFVYLVNLPQQGLWMGATPELLLSKNNAQYKTIALAGTQNIDKPLSEIQWKAKEIEEQAIVVRFVERLLKEKGIHFVKSGSYTSGAANVCHIKTDFLFPPSENPAEMIEAIHPGPAISGMPKKAAVSLIEILENHDREYYCGYLGPLHANGNFDLFINLRCMKVYKNFFKLYVGGGITSQSKIDDEWKETELKAMTLLSVIQNDVAR